MVEITSEQALESLAEALQTMAFASLEPLEGTPGEPADADHYIVQFSGTATGELHLAAPRAFGQVLAANILTTDPASDQAIARAGDVLKELCNITTGLILRQLGEDSCAGTSIGIPSSTPLAESGQWQSFAGGTNVALAAAEGFPLALCVRIQA